MKIKVLPILLICIFILSGIASASAKNYEDGYDPINVKQGDSFKLILLYNEGVDSDGYDSNKLTLLSTERTDPIDGYWANIYTFKANEKGTTNIKIKIALLWWEEERTATVNVT
jgi:hypothetical protein